MRDARSIRNVILKALALFVAANLIFVAWNPAPNKSGGITPQNSGGIMGLLGRISAYNLLFPGRERFPFGEDPARSYNLSLYSLPAMFASHEIAGIAKAPDEYRVILVGDSSVWGILLRPEQTLAGQLNAANLAICGGRHLRTFNLGYPTIALTKDLMVLDQVNHYSPDLVVWLTTLEAFPLDKQLASPIVSNNPAILSGLAARYHLQFNPNDPALTRTDWWGRTIIGQRRPLADLLRLQFYGVLWAATGIDQEYPTNYERAQRDLDSDVTFHGWQPPTLPAEGLALDVLDAGMNAVAATPALLVNEPILVSTGKNSDLRYNFYYPRWVYDQYRQILAGRSQQKGWSYLDLWNLAPENEFTNSAIHLTPAGEVLLTQRLGAAILQKACR
jgi:hypothetical protein